LQLVKELDLQFFQKMRCLIQHLGDGWTVCPCSKMYGASLSVPIAFVVWYLVEYSIISNVM